MIVAVTRPPINLISILAPVIASGAFIGIFRLVPEPKRQIISALIIAGAGAVYYGGGLGWWEVAFCFLFIWLAYLGLTNYLAISFAWILHTVWDVLHHFFGQSILPFVPLSSLGCAICDIGIALWYAHLWRTQQESDRKVKTKPIDALMRIQ